MKMMKVRVNLLIEVDADRWADEYAILGTYFDVRKDIKEYVLDNVQQLYGIQETEASVSFD